MTIDVLQTMHRIAELLATDDYEGSAADLLEARAAVDELAQAAFPFAQWLPDSPNRERLRAALANVQPASTQGES